MHVTLIDFSVICLTLLLGILHHGSKKGKSYYLHSEQNPQRQKAKVSCIYFVPRICFKALSKLPTNQPIFLVKN